MSQLGSVRVTITVEVDPMTAFEVFTSEFEIWYRRGAGLLGDPRRINGLRLEPRLGGRLIELPSGATEAESDDNRVVGRVTVWEPGRRLVFLDWRETEVEVRFDRMTSGTRVSLEHRGLDQLPPDVAARQGKYGWRRLLDWFELHLGGRADRHLPPAQESGIWWSTPAPQRGLQAALTTAGRGQRDLSSEPHKEAEA